MKDHASQKPASLRLIGLESALSAALLWMAQPPLGWWPLAFAAIVPLIRLACLRESFCRRGYLIIWASAAVYWLVSLQGLRHAHWAMHFCWIALSCYLAIYHVLFVFAARSLLSRKRLTLGIVVGVLWTGQECIRNYMLTGISACMLGHALADVPILIQIADLSGTYGVSFVVASVNASVYLIVLSLRDRSWATGLGLNMAIAAVLLGSTIVYGRAAMAYPQGNVLANFALVQRAEPVEYQQSVEREMQIFRDYAADSINALAESDIRIDALVWPESMFTGGNPWMIIDDGAVPPPVPPDRAPLSVEDLKRGVAESQTLFHQRAQHLLGAIQVVRPADPPPRLIVGSGVIRYAERPHVYSGVVNIGPEGEVDGWYGKTHLVMFGEYVPLIPYLPGLRALVPQGLGVTVGPGPMQFRVGDTSVSPNICIETAVERVTINQMRETLRDKSLPGVIVTVTNDGWFDDSSVISHHRRCAQLVAVGARRPILSAANNGPTTSIDSLGQVVDQLPQGTNGVLIASPTADDRVSLYVRIGDWPARLCALVTLVAGVVGIRYRKGS